MLVFSAICPHPPIMIPAIGKDNLDKIKNTVTAMETLAQELYAAKPDLIVTISPHGDVLPEAFSINLNTTYKADFAEFGDWQTKMEFGSNHRLITKFKERVEKELPVVLVTNEKLDHGVAAPLYYLTKHLPGIEIIPINYSLLDHNKHWQFGKLLKKEIAKTRSRIAVIASGDLSHCLIKGAPAPYSPKGEQFDQLLINQLQTQKYQDILKIDEGLIEEAAECGLRSFLILLGIMEEYHHQVKILSYEGPFGVGYLVANFQLI